MRRRLAWAESEDRRKANGPCQSFLGGGHDPRVSGGRVVCKKCGWHPNTETVQREWFEAYGLNF